MVIRTLCYTLMLRFHFFRLVANGRPDSRGKVDRAQLPGGFHHYRWVVYDEIHALNGKEGDALQRLIR